MANLNIRENINNFILTIYAVIKQVIKEVIPWNKQRKIIKLFWNNKRDRAIKVIKKKLIFKIIMKILGKSLKRMDKKTIKNLKNCQNSQTCKRKQENTPNYLKNK